MDKEKNLRKLKRKDLLEILLLQNKKIEELEEELNSTKQLINSREIIISQSGSIAEASLKINKIFEVAQIAADDYLKSIKNIAKNNNKNKKQEYNKKAIINNKE